MSFISREIIGKICESWHTFLLTCKCSYMRLTTCELKAVAFCDLTWMIFYSQNFNDTWLTAQCGLCSHLTSQNKQTLCAITSMKSLDFNIRPHFNTVFDSTLRHIYNAFSFVWDLQCKVHPVAVAIIHLRGLHFFNPYLRGFICVFHQEGRVRRDHWDTLSQKIIFIYFSVQGGKFATNPSGFCKCFITWCYLWLGNGKNSMWYRPHNSPGQSRSFCHLDNAVGASV